MNELKVEDKLELEITGIGKGGDGIAKTEGGFVIIVKNKSTQKGDIVKVVIKKVLKDYAFAEVDKDA